MLYFSLHQGTADGGIMITGSHNEKEYNGFKIAVGTETIYGDAIQELARMIENDDITAGGEGQCFDDPIEPAYTAYLSRACSLEKKLRVVVDGGNGTAGEFACRIFENLGCDVVPLYCAMDGSFPHHHPDPTVPENLDDLVAAVTRHGADLGIAFDGDGDRIGAVDDRGEKLYGDTLMFLFAEEILSRKPGSLFISEVKSSQHLYDEIGRLGGKTLMWKTGHSLIKAKMKETGAVLAGELSGHMFFSDRYFGFDDAIYAACRLLEIVSRSAQPLSALVGRMPRSYKTPEIRIPCDEADQQRIMEKVTAYFRAKDYPLVDIDGVRVQCDGGWGLIRPSHTQPVLTLRFEANSQKELDTIQEHFQTVLTQAQEGTL